jgi:hypothetical protein
MDERAACLEGKWTFEPDVPTFDYFENRDIDEVAELEWVVDDLITELQKGDFLTWEAVVTRELGLPLTEEQSEALNRVVSFNEEPSEGRILYIDDVPRPDRLWYEIVREIAPRLVVEPFNTAEIHYTVITEGWRDLVAALDEHGEGLSLPRGVNRPEEVVPPEIRHRLWLQCCLKELEGLGYGPDLTLADPQEHLRITAFVDALREHKESVAALGLTLESLLTIAHLSPTDKPVFVSMMMETLGLPSAQDLIADRL